MARLPSDEIKDKPSRRTESKPQTGKQLRVAAVTADRSTLRHPPQQPQELCQDRAWAHRLRWKNQTPCWFSFLWKNHLLPRATEQLRQSTGKINKHTHCWCKNNGNEFRWSFPHKEGTIWEACLRLTGRHQPLPSQPAELVAQAAHAVGGNRELPSPTNCSTQFTILNTNSEGAPLVTKWTFQMLACPRPWI